ncbi:MAG: zinc-binding dehydrogenase [Eubacteriales bacterium]|nr:zinc-binding dehydrogenase [Eubacteriales bacterium]
MKSLAVTAEGKLEFVDIPIPEIGEYDALVKVLSCGICNGTDMKIIHHKFKGIDDYPVILGHEGVGEVVKLGAKVRNYAIGDKVLMPYHSNVPAGYSSGWGTYSEYNVVTDAAAMRDDGLIADEFAWGQRTLPSDFDPVSSAMIITFREVLSTMKTFGIAPNMTLAILGLGPVGLSFVKFSKLLGAGTIIAMDIDDEKLALAKKMGADYTINSKKEDVVAGVKKILPEGVDIALDAVGYSPFINTGLAIIKPGAKICVYGISPNMTQEVDWSTCPYNWTLQFNQFPSKVGESEAHDQIVNWIRCGILDPNEFISHVFEFDDAIKAFEKVERHDKMMKMVVKIGC